MFFDSDKLGHSGLQDPHVPRGLGSTLKLFETSTGLPVQKPTQSSSEQRGRQIGS